MSSKALPRTISSYSSNPSSFVISKLEREELDLSFFSLTTSETATIEDRRRFEGEEELWTGLARSLWVDPEKEEAVPRGLMEVLSVVTLRGWMVLRVEKTQDIVFFPCR